MDDSYNYLGFALAAILAGIFWVVKQNPRTPAVDVMARLMSTFSAKSAFHGELQPASVVFDVVQTGVAAYLVGCDHEGIYIERARQYSPASTVETLGARIPWNAIFCLSRARSRAGDDYTVVHFADGTKITIGADLIDESLRLHPAVKIHEV